MSDDVDRFHRVALRRSTRPHADHAYAADELDVGHSLEALIDIRDKHRAPERPPLAVAAAGEGIEVTVEASQCLGLNRGWRDARRGAQLDLHATQW